MKFLVEGVGLFRVDPVPAVRQRVSDDVARNLPHRQLRQFAGAVLSAEGEDGHGEPLVRLVVVLGVGEQRPVPTEPGG